MEVMKVVKGTKDSVSKIKNVAETLVNQIKAVPLELTTIADAAKGVKEAIESGQLIELGKKCREDKVGENILNCYEHAYGKISSADEPKEGGQGCCITF
jgi:phage-related protein